jgi:hypothetical protein
MIIKDDHLYLPTGEGHFISEKQRRISELIAELYPHIELQWIPPDQRGPDDFAFRVVDCIPGRPPYVVLFANECDERILARLIQADNTKRDINNYLDCHNAAVELYEAKKRREERMELHEFMYAALRSRKINWRHKGFNFGAPNGGR